MKIVLGSDHRGFTLKHHAADWLRDQGHTIQDLGPTGPERADYPDFASAVAHHVADHPDEFGILMCGSGIGMSIAANKVDGIRAALCYQPELAELSRRHNNANVLCLSADLVPEEVNLEIIRSWLAAPFDGGRHQDRLAKIAKMETD